MVCNTNKKTVQQNDDGKNNYVLRGDGSQESNVTKIQKSGQQ